MEIQKLEYLDSDSERIVNISRVKMTINVDKTWRLYKIVKWILKLQIKTFKLWIGKRKKYQEGYKAFEQHNYLTLEFNWPLYIEHCRKHICFIRSWYIYKK